MWGWLCELTPYPSTLESLRIQRTDPAIPEKCYPSTSETVPSWFLRRVAEVHGSSLKHLVIETAQLTGDNFNFVCESFSAVELLAVFVQGHNIVRSRLSSL